MGLFGRGFIVLACVALGACASFTPRQSPKPSTVYTLDKVGKIERAEQPRCATVAVDTVRSAPGYGTARMIYSRNPHQLQAFAYNKWADSPASMLQSVMVNALEKSGRFGDVLTRAPAGASKLRLESDLVALRQQFSGDESKLLFQMRVRLFNNEQVLGSRLFELREAAGEGPESGVKAANRATAKFTEELVAWVDETLGKAPQVCQ